MNQNGWGIVVVMLLLSNSLLTYLTYILWYSPMIKLVKSILISLVYLSSTWLLTFFYKTFSINGHCPCFENVVFPCLKLISMFLAIFLLNIDQIGVFYLILNSLLIIEILNLSPSFYSINFLQFLHYYQIFSVPVYKPLKGSTPLKEPEFTTFQKSLKAESDPKLIQDTSLSESNSESTLFLLQSDSQTPLLYTSLPPRSNPQSIPVLAFPKVDTLYSISPRNTYHLNKAVAIASDYLNGVKDFNGIKDNDSILASSASEETVLGEVVDNGEVENIKHNTSETTLHFVDYTFGKNRKDSVCISSNSGLSDFSDQAIAENCRQSNYGSCNGCSNDVSENMGSNFDLEANVCGNTKSCSARMKDWLNSWFQSSSESDCVQTWIIPRKSSSISENPYSWFFSEKTKQPTLKTKLSRYSLNSQVQGCGHSDFNHQAEFVLCNHPYLEFVEFLNQFCDVHKNIAIDPIFKKFGILLTKFPLIFIFLDTLNSSMWNLLTLILFYKFGITALFICIILKLIKQNLFDSKIKVSTYKVLLLSEFFINCCLLGFIFIEFW